MDFSKKALQETPLRAQMLILARFYNIVGAPWDSLFLSLTIRSDWADVAIFVLFPNPMDLHKRVLQDTILRSQMLIFLRFFGTLSAHLEFHHFHRLRSDQIVPMLRLLFYLQNLMDSHNKCSPIDPSDIPNVNIIWFCNKSCTP